MTEMAELIHYGTIVCAVAIPAIGVGIGQGFASGRALDAIDQQPMARADITKVTILGMALIETAAVMGTFVAFLLLFGTKHITHTTYTRAAEIGIACAICLPGFVLGLISALPARAACYAVARQPFFTNQITRFMLITLSLIQTPIIFGMITALFIQTQIATITTVRDSMRLIASGIAIGFGSIGPAIGLALFADSACRGIGINRTIYNQLLSFTFISQAIIETPIIFSFMVALVLLLFIPGSPTENILHGIAMLSASLCIGLGTMGPGISSGRTAAQACTQITWHPELYGILSRISMFAQGIIETCAIYAVLISFLLLFMS